MDISNLSFHSKRSSDGFRIFNFWVQIQSSKVFPATIQSKTQNQRLEIGISSKLHQQHLSKADVPSLMNLVPFHLKFKILMDFT